MSKTEKKYRFSVPLALRIILISSLLLLFLATVAEHYRSSGNPVAIPTPTDVSTMDNLIVPGTRIGPVTLGLRIDDLTKNLGKGQKRPVQDGVLHLYENLGLIIYEENGLVTSVSVRSPQFATRQEIRVGSDVDAVLSQLGRNYELEGTEEDYVLHNWSQGWHVGVKNNVVTYFRITPPITP